MTEKIVVVGRSSLSFLLSRVLERTIGRRVECRLIYLTEERQLVCPWANYDSPKAFIDQVACLPHAKVISAKIREINLHGRRIVTGKGVIGYDHLVLDLTPSYTFSQLTEIQRHLSLLASHHQARWNTGERPLSRAYFSGQSADVFQLALTSRVWLPPTVGVQVDFSGSALVDDFLRANNLSVGTTAKKVIGLTVAPPDPVLPAKKVHGLPLDEAGWPIVNRNYHPNRIPEVVVIGGEERSRANLLDANITLAEGLASNVEAVMEGKREKLLPLPKPAYVLRGPSGRLWSKDGQYSRRLRALFWSKINIRQWRYLSQKR